MCLILSFAGTNCMAQYFVTAERERPDFRLVIAFLWHDLHNVDTDGDSDNPASRTWTSLLVRNRQDESEIVTVNPVANTPLILRIESENEHLAARTAYFLSEFMSVGIAQSEDGPFQPPETILHAVGSDFDVAEGMRRVASSPFIESTLNDPYPNLRRK